MPLTASPINALGYVAKCACGHEAALIAPTALHAAQIAMNYGWTFHHGSVKCRTCTAAFTNRENQENPK